MSVVTNIVLVTAILDQDAVRENLQPYLEIVYNAPLVQVPPEAHGGNKFLECRVYTGAYNYLDVADFLVKFHEIEWSYPENVVLVIDPQEGDLVVCRGHEVNRRAWNFGNPVVD